MYRHLILPLIKKIDPEKAHQLAIKALKMPVPFVSSREYDNLKTSVMGLNFNNPIGMAAGFDKNAEVISGLKNLGFGFVEAGTVTKLPQEGNPRPRMFRLAEDEAVINRLGFNGSGINVFLKNIEQHKAAKAITGVNIGRNKDTVEPLFDYIELLSRVQPVADYITINISSPNTPGLRDIQARAVLDEFLGGISTRRQELKIQTGLQKPILVKIAPDLHTAELEDIVELCIKHGMDGIIATNTTISRPSNLISPYKIETGGLSGKPVRNISTKMIAEAYKLAQGKLIIVGVGGISSGRDAYEKIQAGASLVQLYTAMVYNGFGIAEQVKTELSKLLQQDGFKNVSEAVGSKTRTPH